MDARHPQLPPAWQRYAEAALALGARLTTAALSPGRSGTRLEELARRLYREFDGMAERAFAALPEGGGPACAPGCDHCCRTLPVTVTPVEVLVMGHHMLELVAADPALAARITAAGAALRRLSPPAADAAPTGAVSSTAPGPLPPCPLLGDGGLCLLYKARPLACRGCMSADADACAACDDARLVPRSTAHQLGAAALARGVCDALDSLGLVSRPMDIRAGLALVLADEEAERRWLRGEDVFAGL